MGPAIDPQVRSTLIVFLRQPVAGRVKTRLAATLGAEAAANVYARLVDITLSAAGKFPGTVLLLFDGELPPESHRNPSFQYGRQAEGELGLRMGKALRDALGNADRVVLVGSDCPGIEAGILEEAIDRLKDHDVVIGPSTDGGYYLIGCRRPPAEELFTDIAWSTDSVLETTLKRCRELELSTTLLKPLSDIDKEEDLRRLEKLLFPDRER